ncbi:MAG: acyl dehydratase [Proteobacteria bacterium]|nr:acyl dehydratase [Pseudomonadota bacterium]
MTVVTTLAGPYFEDLRLGLSFDAPAVTLTEGHAALYQAITGDRLALPLDHDSARKVTGLPRPLAHPMLAINLAVGQTTWASQRVKANLFYRGLILKQPVLLGDTLATTTRVVGLKQNTPKPGRPATGIVALEMTTRNQQGDEVLHFWRCPMIPCRTDDAATGHQDDLAKIGIETTAAEMCAAIPQGWQLDRMRIPQTPDAISLAVGSQLRIEARDTVTSAPELVRLTLNMAMAHTDASLSYLGERLVYGGHTIAIAFAQLTRAIPSLITLVAWESCDHTAPVIENDRLRSAVTIVESTPVTAGRLLRLHVETYATRSQPDEPSRETESKVLDWRLAVWCAR